MSYIPFPDISPEIFRIDLGGFSFALRWYALAYIVGLVAGWKLIARIVSTPRLWTGTPPMTAAQVESLLTWVILGVVLGGRLGFVLFYQPGYYLQNPGHILRVWEGGMSFHGGFLGVVVAGILFCRLNRIPMLSAADLMAIVAPIGIGLGRIANFINAELWGRPTTLPWGVAFPGEAAQTCTGVVGVCARHPSQLYEAALEGALLFAVLLWLAYRRRWLSFPGRIAGLFFAGYGAARFLVEFVRQPDAQFVTEGNPLGLALHAGGYGLTMGQLLSLPMIVAGLWFIARARRTVAGPGMTALADILKARIAATGPMTLADYMADCLLHPAHGYYATRDPFGAQGDFTTAPEISQMFGELMGLCLAQTWLDQGSPSPFTLAELGPGRGTLMADILRATRAVPGFHTAANVMLVEASPTLRRIQRTTLGTHSSTWADSADALPEAPLFLIANEFFDALPIRQFTRQGDGWAETVVGLTDGHLTLGRTSPTPLAQLEHRLADTQDGDIVETCPAAQPVMARIGHLIATCGGTAILIDYGNWRSRGDTFQALENHRFADPLANPGNADLTAHVDFEALATAAKPAAASRMIPQGALLQRLGIDARADRLAKSLTGDALQSHRAAHHRLTDSTEMGSLFKALAIHPAHLPPPPGFDPADA